MTAKIPEAELVRRTYTLRVMDLPPSVSLTKRSLLRWFALAFGIISEQESRSTIFDVLDSLFYHQFTKKTDPTSADLQAYLKSKGRKVSDKLLLYHFKRLQDSGLVQRRKGKYLFCSDAYSDKSNLAAGFKSSVASAVNKSLEDIQSVLGKLADGYRR
ncbi:MAG TPA: hypothetical protein HA252_02125 [Candidatus Diapherotrites archaeon]|uniref:Uncharacterized protein n=1 Tax=Candidatus Iainarchaeum sp. TaxID=3101447 RepID=A0A7J4JEP0_9ARCH|nr:hypothetical protein [Candidatus Diapherotrites archaeon]